MAPGVAGLRVSARGARARSAGRVRRDAVQHHLLGHLGNAHPGDASAPLGVHHAGDDGNQ